MAWFGVLLVVGAFLAVQVGRQVYANWEITQRADAMRQAITDAEARNEALREELRYLESDAYVSAEARRFANLGEAGEQVLIIPLGAEAPLPAELQPPQAPPEPLLAQWLRLFFGS
jgi:cell division protein FtsB